MTRLSSSIPPISWATKSTPTINITMTVNGQASTEFENLPLNDPTGRLFYDSGDPQVKDIVIRYQGTS